ncbi:MAG: hypothetical protein ACJA02_001192 [Myxococcota bacterium]
MSFGSFLQDMADKKCFIKIITIKNIVPSAAFYRYIHHGIGDDNQVLEVLENFEELK